MVLVIISNVLPAFELNHSGPKVIILGENPAMEKGDMFGSVINPALIRGKLKILASYSILYQLTEINSGDITAEYSAGNIPVMTGANYYGNQFYHETTIRAGTAYMLEDIKTSVGISINYYSLEISHYGSDQCVGINLGINYDLYVNLSLAASITNINQPVIGQQEEKLPQQMRTGIRYQPVTGIMLYASVFQENGMKESYRVAMQIKITEWLQVIAGICDEPDSWSAGLEILSGKIHSVLGMQFHPVLGNSLLISTGMDL